MSNEETDGWGKQALGENGSRCSQTRLLRQEGAQLVLVDQPGPVVVVLPERGLEHLPLLKREPLRHGHRRLAVALQVGGQPRADLA